jgi:GTP-sensing pleiotropic transcriptional regulator CodY
MLIIPKIILISRFHDLATTIVPILSAIVELGTFVAQAQVYHKSDDGFIFHPYSPSLVLPMGKVQNLVVNGQGFCIELNDLQMLSEGRLGL